VQRLQQELYAARQAYATAQKTCGELTATLQDCREENESLRSQLRQHQQLQEEARSYKQKSNDFEDRLLEQEAESKRLRGRNTVLDEELTRCDMHLPSRQRWMHTTTQRV
jgi:chromosome segregation ATPase